MSSTNVLVVACIFDSNPRFFLLEGVTDEERSFLEDECHNRFVYLEAPDQDYHSVRRLGALLNLGWNEPEDIDEEDVGRFANTEVDPTQLDNRQVDSVIYTGQKR